MKKLVILLATFLLSTGLVFAQTDPNEDVPPTDIPNPSGAHAGDTPPTDIAHPSGGSVTDVPPTDIPNPSGPNPGPGAQPVNPAPADIGSFLHIDTPANHGLPTGDLSSMIQRLLNNGLSVVALIGILGLLFAAIQMWLSQGKADGIGHAKVNIFNILLGFAIVLLAWSGVTVVLKFLGF